MGGDYTCLIHGKKMSEHDCIYCCLCFKSLTLEQCHLLSNGKREDVCNECAARETKLAQLKKEAGKLNLPPLLIEGEGGGC